MSAQRNKGQSVVSVNWECIVDSLTQKLRRDLAAYFSPANLHNTERWLAIPIGAESSAPAATKVRFRYEYRYPAPVEIANSDSVLDFLSPAICGYCASCEYYRNKSTALVDALVDLAADWAQRKTALRLAKKMQGSMSGRKQKKKIDPKGVSERVKNGESQKAIAVDLGVTPQAISKALKKFKNQPS